MVGREIRLISPRELQPRASPRDAQPAGVQGAFQFLVEMDMHEAGKFELVNVAEIDGRLHYAFSGADEVFSVMRPKMSQDTETKVREAVRGGLARFDNWNICAIISLHMIVPSQRPGKL